MRKNAGFVFFGCLAVSFLLMLLLAGWDLSLDRESWWRWNRYEWYGMALRGIGLLICLIPTAFGAWYMIDDR